VRVLGRATVAVCAAWYKSPFLHSFGGAGDGIAPLAGLIEVSGTLYGTTGLGGGYRCEGGRGCGTVFSITPSGVETVLHSFGGPGDGAGPGAALVNVGGPLCGTTFSYGASGNGTVFSITAQGVETVLYSFAGGSDGSGPSTSLINVGGALYGTTGGGGAYGDGTAFKVTRNGSAGRSAPCRKPPMALWMTLGGYPQRHRRSSDTRQQHYVVSKWLTPSATRPSGCLTRRRQPGRRNPLSCLRRAMTGIADVRGNATANEASTAAQTSQPSSSFGKNLYFPNKDYLPNPR